MNSEWYSNFTKQYYLSQLEANNLIPNNDNIDTFITTLHTHMKTIAQEAKDSHNYTKLFYKLLEQPHVLFQAFFNSIVYTVEEHNDHTYNSFHGLRGVFNDIMIDSANKYSPAETQSSAETNSSNDDMVSNDNSIVGNKTVAYIAGWSLVRARRVKPHLSQLVAILGADVLVNGKYEMEAGEDYILFYKALSTFIHSKMNEESFQTHRGQLPQAVKDMVKCNLPIRLQFRGLLAGQEEHKVTALLQEIVQGTIQSATKQFLSTSHKHPNKESHAHRISVSLENNIKTKGKRQERFSKDCVSSKCKIKATNWVACDKCCRWWHYKCAGMTKKTVPEGAWFCGSCRD